MKYHLVFARETEHGVYTDHIPCESHLMALEIMKNLEEQGFASKFVIIKGELITDEG